MFSLFGRKSASQEKKSDFKIEEDENEEEDSVFVKSLQVNLSRLIAYAESADFTLQREVKKKKWKEVALFFSLCLSSVEEKLAVAGIYTYACSCFKKKYRLLLSPKIKIIIILGSRKTCK